MAATIPDKEKTKEVLIALTGKIDKIEKAVEKWGSTLQDVLETLKKGKKTTRKKSSSQKS